MTYKFDCHEPLTYPYGWKPTSLAQLLIVVAWTTSLLTISSCYMIEARPIPEENDPPRISLGYGFLSLEGGGESETFFKCGRYTDFEQEQHIDAWWQVATAFAFFACIIGGIISLVLLSTCCLAFHDHYIFEKMFKVLIVCFIMQILVFLAYANVKLCNGDDETEYICTWGSGSALNITAALLWLLAAYMIRKFPEYYVGGLEEQEGERVHDAESPPKKPKLKMLTAAPKKKAPLKMITAAPEERPTLKVINDQLPQKSKKTKKPKRPTSNVPRITTGEPGSPKGRKPSSSSSKKVKRITTGDGTDYDANTGGGRRKRR